jgi:hypothetical protein
LKRRRAIRAFKKKLKKFGGGSPSATSGIKGEKVMVMKDGRDLLVEVLAFCLMPNHIHLLLRQLKEGGISKFMLKLESGYAAYFEKK